MIAFKKDIHSRNPLRSKEEAPFKWLSWCKVHQIDSRDGRNVVWEEIGLSMSGNLIEAFTMLTVWIRFRLLLLHVLRYSEELLFA